MKDPVVGIRECPQETSDVDASALLDRARSYRPYNALNDGALVQSLVALVEDLQIKLALAGPLYSARQLQPKLDEAYEALEPFGRLAEAYFYRYETRPGEWRELHENDPDEWAVYGINYVQITTGDFRRARKALENRKTSLADANPETRSYHAREQGQ